MDDAARLLDVRAGVTGTDVGDWIRLGGADDVFYENSAVDTTASELTLATKFYGTAATLNGRDLGVAVPSNFRVSTRRRWSTSRTSSK